MAKRPTKAEIEQDVSAMRTWLASLWAPVSTFFEGRYVWLALLPIGIWVWLDRALLKTWIGLLLALVILAGLALQLRKVVFPYVNLADFAKKAQEDPIAAALVFLGCVGYMVALILIGVLWLGGLKA